MKAKVVALAFVFLLSLACKLLYVRTHEMDNFVIVDARAYHEMADNLINGVGYFEGSAEDGFRDGIKRASPLQVFFMAGIYRLFGVDPWNVIYAQVLLASSLCIILYATMETLTNDWKVSFQCSLIGAFFPDFTILCGVMVPETLTFFLLALFALLASSARIDPLSGRRVVRQKSAAAIILIGLVSGLLTLARPQFLPVGILFFAFLALRSWKDGKWPSWPLWGGCLVFLGVLAPFTARNYLKYQEIIYASTTLSCNILVGNQLNGDGEYHLTQTTRELLLPGRREGPIEQRDRCKEELGRLVSGHPSHVLKMLLVKFFKVFSASRTTAGWFHITSKFERLSVQLLDSFIYLILFSFSISYMLRQRRLLRGTLLGGEAGFFFLLVASSCLTVAVLTIMYFNQRYRVALLVLFIPAAVLEFRVIMAERLDLGNFWPLPRLLFSAGLVSIFTFVEIVIDWNLYMEAV